MYEHPTNTNQAVAVTCGFISVKRRKGICTKQEGRGGPSSQVYEQIWGESFPVVWLTIMVTVGA